MDSEFIGAVKIKDGLFTGDKPTSQDLDFIVSSKVTHIINTSSSEVNNEWASIGITYLSYPWTDTEDQIIFDDANNTFNQCYNFIDSTLEKGESVLIHSVKGESRCICVVLSYIMKKYKWSLTKSLEFLNSRKPDCKLKPNFLFQLVKLENSLARTFGHSLSKDWEPTQDPEETVLAHTYLNSRPGNFVQFNSSKIVKRTRLKWADGGKLDKARLETQGVRNAVEDGVVLLKSCLKGCDSTVLAQVPKLGKGSKSLNTLTVKNFSDSAKEYGSFEDLKAKKPVRNNSVSKRENSPLLREFKKGVMKIKKKLPNFALMGFVEINKAPKKEPGKGRGNSARPSSPYVKKDLKDLNLKQQILKPIWKF